MAGIWEAHDRVARDLLPPHRGREIDKTDGMLLLFDEPADAIRYAVAYHRGLAELSGREGVQLAARAGLHVGDVILRENTADDVARGAKPLEVEGLAKPMAARVMSLGCGGQTLVSGDAMEALGEVPEGLESRLHGHYRLKGVNEPVPLHEIGTPDEAPFLPPKDAAKAYRVVMRGDAWVPVTDVPHNLPAERNAFFGRVPELRELADRLKRGQRLVTLLGPGGTGKSRLSLEFARRWRGDWPGGTWFCELEEVATAEELVAAVARAAGIRLEGGDAAAWVAARLAQRPPTLFLLDNFEQLVQHADVIDQWITGTPNTAWVVSSRERLQLGSEHVVRLEALRVPRKGALVNEVLACEAAQMFATRATAASAKFGLDERNAASVGELVRLLDGMPLAIELAAARVPVMSPDKMVKRMSQRFKLLAGKRRGVTRRQATLRGAIDWSWDLIEPWERLALAQCSVFRGGFTLEAAEAVLDLDAFEDAPWPMDVVHGLVDKSLLRTMQVPGPERVDLDEPLLGMYQSIRDYSDEKLRDPRAVAGPDGEPLTGPDAVLELRLRHAQHFGSDIDEKLESSRSRDGMLALLADRDNLGAAFEAALAVNEPDLATDCWTLLARVAQSVGPVDSVVRSFDRLPLDRAQPDSRIRALDHQKKLRHDAGYDTTELSERVLQHWQQVGDPERTLLAMVDLAGAGSYRDPKAALSRMLALEDRVMAELDAQHQAHFLHNTALAMEDPLPRLREAASRHEGLKGGALYNIGVVLCGAERYAEALDAAGEVESWAKGRPEEGLFSMFVRTLRGQILARMGRWEEARPVLTEGIELARQFGSHRFVNGGYTQTLVRLELRDGAVAAARARVEASLPLLRALQDPAELAWGLSSLAEVCLAEGDLVGAREAIDQAHALVPEIETSHAHVGIWVRDTRLAVEAAEA
jgi:predicted ATPase/tetratricopeptide (TPR) repeat protein